MMSTVPDFDFAAMRTQTLVQFSVRTSSADKAALPAPLALDLVSSP